MYIYQHLRHPEDVRLLFVEPRDKSADDVIRMTILRCNINDAPSYTALSYTWGERDQMVKIKINGQLFEVTPNLHIALEHLRQDLTARTLWIDAICINQIDDAEKTQQVLRMREIYAKAGKVIMWVGQEDELTRTIFNTLERFAGSWEERTDPMLRNLEDPDGVRSAVKHFLQRPYFNRIWIVQEIIVSNTAVVTCGRFSMLFDRFYNAFQQMTASGFYQLSGPVYKVTNMGLWKKVVQQQLEGQSELDLKLLLQDTRDRDASDPRDKVFALLGIANLAGEASIGTDYSKSVEEVYTTVARCLLRTGSHLEPLSAVQSYHRALRLPSWVADWSQPWRGGGVLNRPRRFANGQCFRAAGASKATVIDVKDPEALCLRGFQLDAIKRSHDLRPCIRLTDESLSSFTEERLRDEIVSLGLSGIYPFTGEPYQAAYFRTISADRTALSERVDDLYSKKYLAAFAEWDRNGRPGSHPPNQVWEEVTRSIVLTIEDKDIFITERGYLGLGHNGIQVDDKVCVLLGAVVPFILRPQNENEYQFMGECYVHGIMDGEAMEDSSEKIFEDFVIK